MTFEHDQITSLDLMAYADDRLDPVRRRTVEVHLARHPDAAAQVEAIIAQNEWLRRSLAPIAAEPVPERLTAVLAAAPRRSSLPLLQAASVLGLAVLSGLGGWWLGTSAISVAGLPPAFLAGVEPSLVTPGIGGLQPRTAPTGSAPTGEPVAEAAGSTEHAAWFTDGVTVELRAPALGDRFASPERQWLVEIDGRPTARFELAGPDGRALALYLQTRPATTPEIRVVEAASGSTAYWRDGPLVWALEGELSRAELEALARHIGTAIELEPRLGTVATEHTGLPPLPPTRAGG